jgi:hypothetical protein
MQFPEFDMPVYALNVPALQGKQEDWPGEGLNVPWGHGKQILWTPFNEVKYPAAHGTQSDEDELPPPRVELPAGQDVHADADNWPGKGLNVPWGQTRQELAEPPESK